MLIELLSNSNNQTYNVWLAHKIGLNVAIYFSVLLDDYKLSITENRVDENQFFSPNRKFITAKTTFSNEEQYQFEETLNELGFINLSQDKLKCKFNLTLLVGMLDLDEHNVEEYCKTVISKVNKPTKADNILIGVKRKINKNYPGNVQAALSDWLTTLNDKYGYVNKSIILKAQQELDSIIYSDLNKAFEIIEIATVQAYRDMTWAITRYNDFHKNDNVKTTVLNTKQNLSNDYF